MSETAAAGPNISGATALYLALLACWAVAGAVLLALAVNWARQRMVPATS